MKYFSSSLTILFLLLILSVNVQAAQFSDVSDKKGADLPEVVTNIEGADVIFIGEIHDSAQIHRGQLDILRSLQGKKVPLAIGLEIFTTADQQALDDWIAGKLDQESFRQVYSRNWSVEWPLYQELLVFAKDNHIPLIALNVPKPVMSKAMAQGASGISEGELPPKMSWSLNEAQAFYMRTIAGQVFGNPPPDPLVARLSKAQALRNHWMAWNVAKYRERHEGDKVVVIAGTWHAVKTGVPELLAAYGKVTYKVILPELPEFNLKNATVKEADYLMMRQGATSP